MPPTSQYESVSVDETGDATPVKPRAKMPCGIERRHRKSMTLFVCLATAFIFAVNGGVLLVVIPVLAEDFNTTTEIAAWANIIPMFIAAMIGTQMGKVADKYGRARTWHVGMSFELISHAACGWAGSMPQLLAGRAIGGLGMGIGAGSAFGLMAAGMPPKQRGVAAAWMMLMGTLGRSFGTSIGGIVMDAYGWRWLFIGPVPVLVMFWVTAYFVLPFDAIGGGGGGGGDPGKKGAPPAKDAPLDWAGSVALAVGLSFCLIFVNRGNEWGWGSPIIITVMILAAVTLPILACIEKKAEAPIIPFSVFQDHVSALCIIISNTSSFNIGGFQMIPIYLQLARGMNPGDVGLLVMFRPMMGAAVSFTLSRTVMKRPDPPYRFLIRMGSVFNFLSCVALPFVYILPLTT